MSRKPAHDFLPFLTGGALFAAGIVPFTNQVMVGTGTHGMPWGFGRGWGAGPFMAGPFGLGGGGAGQSFGLLMIPFGAGVVLLLADAYRWLGWVRVWGSAAAIGTLVLQSLIFSFRPARLWTLLSMVIMVAGGGGLMLRSLRDYREEESSQLRSRLDHDAP